MTSYDAALVFLEKIGAVRAPDGPEPVQRRSTWRLGTTTLIVSEPARGGIRVDEVLVSSASVAEVLEVIGDLHARHVAPRGSGRAQSAAE
jgi:hypothetical protein